MSDTPDTPDQAGELPPELADLAHLAAAADSRNAAQDAPTMAAGESPPTVADQGADLAALLGAVVSMAEPMAPYLPRAYTPEVCDRIGQALAAVAEKRGWDLTQVMSPEVVLLFVTVPPTIAAVKMAKDYYAWLEQQAREQQRKPAAVVPLRPEPAPAG